MCESIYSVDKGENSMNEPWFLVNFHPVIKKLFLVMAGGALGAVSRYGIGLWTAKAWGTQFPFGTLMVNLAGCFLIGLIFTMAERVRFPEPGPSSLAHDRIPGGSDDIFHVYPGNR